MSAAARKAAVEIAAAFGRRLTSDHVEEIAACIDRHLVAAAATAADPTSAPCTICGVEPEGGTALDLGDLLLCARCGDLYLRAIREGGAVVRYVCRPSVVGDRACGRVQRVGYTTLRTGPFVVDGEASCEACREGRRADRRGERCANPTSCCASTSETTV